MPETLIWWRVTKFRQFICHLQRLHKTAAHIFLQRQAVLERTFTHPSLPSLQKLALITKKIYCKFLSHFTFFYSNVLLLSHTFSYFLKLSQTFFYVLKLPKTSISLDFAAILVKPVQYRSCLTLLLERKNFLCLLSSGKIVLT